MATNINFLETVDTQYPEIPGFDLKTDPGEFSLGKGMQIGGMALQGIGLLKSNQQFDASRNALEAAQNLLPVQSQMYDIASAQSEQAAILKSNAALYNAKLSVYNAAQYKSIGNYNASVYEADADATLTAYKYEVDKMKSAGNAFLGDQITKYAKQGVMLGTGSAQDVAFDIAEDLQREENITEYIGKVKETKLRNLATQSEWSGNMLATKAEMQATIDEYMASGYLIDGQYSKAMYKVQSLVTDYKKYTYEAQKEALGAKQLTSNLSELASLSMNVAKYMEL